MVNYFIYARDCSFSTLNNEYYHSNGLKTLEQFKRDVKTIKELSNAEEPCESKIVYLHWGDDCLDVDEEETRVAYINMECEQMGTDPERLIEHLQKKYIVDDNDKIKLLYIITDGLINNNSVQKCFKNNEFMHYETVVFHAFNEEKENIDFSVAASFFKSRCMVYRNYKLYVSTDISKEFEYDKINIYNFAAKKDQLKSYITLKFINKYRRDVETLEEGKNLKKLKDRLTDELLDAMKSKKTESVNSNLIITAIKTNLDVEKSISALITCINSSVRSYSFDALTFNVSADESTEEEMFEDNIDYTGEEEFEIFDFTLEDDVKMPIPYGNIRMVDVT